MRGMCLGSYTLDNLTLLSLRYFILGRNNHGNYVLFNTFCLLSRKF